MDNTCKFCDEEGVQFILDCLHQICEPCRGDIARNDIKICVCGTKIANVRDLGINPEPTAPIRVIDYKVELDLIYKLMSKYNYLSSNIDVICDLRQKIIDRSVISIDMRIAVSSYMSSMPGSIISDPRNKNVVDGAAAIIKQVEKMISQKISDADDTIEICENQISVLRRAIVGETADDRALRVIMRDKVFDIVSDAKLKYLRDVDVIPVFKIGISYINPGQMYLNSVKSLDTSNLSVSQNVLSSPLKHISALPEGGFMYCTGENINLITPQGNKSINCPAAKAVMHKNMIYAINRNNVYRISITGLVTTITSRLTFVDIAVVNNAVYMCSNDKLFAVTDSDTSYTSTSAIHVFKGKSHKVIPTPDGYPAVIEIDRERPYVRYTDADQEKYPHESRQVICASQSLLDDKIIYMTYRVVQGAHQYKIFHDHNEIICTKVTNGLQLELPYIEDIIQLADGRIIIAQYTSGTLKILCP